MIQIVSDPPLVYLWDGVTLPALSFTCTIHTPPHTWLYIRKPPDDKTIVRVSEEQLDEVCSQFQAL